MEPNQASSGDRDTPGSGSPHGEIIGVLLKDGCLTEDQVRYALRVQGKLISPRPLLEVVKDLKYVSDETIRDSIRKNRVSMRIGSLLVELGIISESVLEHAFAMQKDSGKKLGEILVNSQLIDERIFLDALSMQMGFPFIEPEFTEIDRKLFLTAPARWYETHHFIPIRMEEGVPLIAFADPLDPHDLKGARDVFGAEYTAAISSHRAVREAISKTERRISGERVVRSDESSVVGMVNAILSTAVQGRASDIHIEPMKDRIRIRFRKDGVLVHHKDLPLDVGPSLISRIKILSECDITEKRRHQGGRFFFEDSTGPVDLRVSFYVTVHGEKIVMRILNRPGELLDIKDIGMSPKILHRFLDNALYRPSGVLIITGPTGSGKTSTIYSCINDINDPTMSIITAEEPVEYVIDGISQCSINPKINLTFEETLRHIVRQDPDVIVIGEIRDKFTADVAVHAALTGHKVLTTFHTEDSIGGLIRLMNMDIETFLISSTVVCVVAQRLLRRICPHCSEPYTPTPAELQRLGYGLTDVKGNGFRKGRGCTACDNSGYRGRSAVFELLVLDEAVRNAVIERKTSHQIRQLSIESGGLVTLFEDGILKADAGTTTLEEVLRCLPKLNRPRPLPEIRRLSGV